MSHKKLHARACKLRKTALQCDNSRIPRPDSRGTPPQPLCCKACSEFFFQYLQAIYSSQTLQNGSSILLKSPQILHHSDTFSARLPLHSRIEIPSNPAMKPLFVLAAPRSIPERTAKNPAPRKVRPDRAPRRCPRT